MKGSILMITTKVRKKGNTIEYEVIRNGHTVTLHAKVVDIFFHPQVGPSFWCESPYGNKFQLSRKEIKRFLPKKK